MFEYEGGTLFLKIKRGFDGTTIITRKGKEGKSLLVGADGKAYEYEEQKEFSLIHRSPNGLTSIRVDTDKDILLMPDGSLFKYKEEKIFPEIDPVSNNSYRISVSNENPTLKVSEDSEQQLDVKPVAKKYILVLQNGELFSYKGQTEFEFLIRPHGGSIEIKYDGLYVWVNDKGEKQTITNPFV